MMRTTALLMFLVALAALAPRADAQMLEEILPNAPLASSGGGTNAGYPFNTWYMDNRFECVYLPSELIAAGLYAGAQINQIQLMPNEAPGMMIEMVRLRLGHFSGTAHPGSYRTQANLTQVYQVASIQPAQVVPNQWYNFPLSTPFVWNGVDALVFDYTNDGNSYQSGGGIAMRTPPGSVNRHLRGYHDNVSTWPFDTGLLGPYPGQTVPRIRLGFPPPQLTVLLQNPPSAREEQPYSTFATAVEWPVFAPYSWSMTPIQNASWMSINPTTGEITGTPPVQSAGAVSFSVTVANAKVPAETDTKTFNINVIGVPNIVPSYFDNFNNLQYVIDQYDQFLGPLAEVQVKAAAAQGGSGLGVRLSSSQGIGTFTPIDVGQASHRAMLDNPALWEGGGVVDPSDYVGKVQLSTRAPGVQSCNVSFHYRIEQTSAQPSAANAKYYNQFVFEYSSDHGQTWTIASGSNATTANGIYREPTAPNFTFETIAITGLSGAQNQMLRFRFRWICRLKDQVGSVQTYIDIDNFRIEVPFTITTFDIPDGTATIPYEYENGIVQLQHVSGQAPLTFTATPHPSWLQLDTATGRISGLPGAGDAGNYSINFSASDVTQNVSTRVINFNIRPAPSPVTFTNLSSLPEAAESTFYQYALTAFGGAMVEFGTGNPRYNWSITTNPQSSWLSVHPTSGVLTGTPPPGSLGNTINFTAFVNDGLYGTSAETSANSATRTFYISIVEKLTITTSELPLAREGSTFRPQLIAAGGVAPYSWSLVGGSLPDGVYFDPILGRLVGTPYLGESGLYNLVFSVTDAGVQSQSINLTLTVAGSLDSNSLEIITQELDPEYATEAQPFSGWVDAIGGVPPYSWSIPVTSPDQLPPGLTLDGNGQIYGTPFAGVAREYSLDVQVTDARRDEFGNPNPQSFTQRVILDVRSQISPPTIGTTVLQIAEVGFSYPPAVPFAPPNLNAPALRVLGGSPPFHWVMTSGSLPAGLELSPVGLIAGVPEFGSHLESPYAITLRVTDGNNLFDERSYLLEVAPFSGQPLAMIQTTPPAANIGQGYSFRLTANGGANPTGSPLPYVFRRISGSLPNGMDLDPFGQIRGSPAPGSEGDWPFTVEVRDPAGHTAVGEVNLIVVNLSGGGMGASSNNPQVEVQLEGSGSGCAVTGSGSSSTAWIVSFLVIAGLAMRRRRSNAC
jgi:MYXO-CTERM domain-containing protein